MMENDLIRAKMLKMLYDQFMSSPGIFYPQENFYKMFPDVPKSMIDANQLYLHGKGLVKGPHALGVVTPNPIQITSKGIDVVEHPDRFKDLSINLQFIRQSIRVSGDVHGPIAAGSNITQITVTFDTAKDAVKSRSDLDQKTKQEIYQRLKELETELEKDTPSKSKIAQLKEYFSQYGWLIAQVVELIKKAYEFLQ